MKRNTGFFTCLLLGCLISACHSSPRQTTNKDSVIVKTDSAVTIIDTSLEGLWRLQPQLPSDTAAGRIPEIIFSATENRFSGNTGCNRMTGIFMRKADSLRFDERIVTTRMACMGYNEKIFLDNLLRTNRFVIKGGVLMLMENETVLSKWVRHLEDQPIKKA